MGKHTVCCGMLPLVLLLVLLAQQASTAQAAQGFNSKAEALNVKGSAPHLARMLGAPSYTDAGHSARPTSSACLQAARTCPGNGWFTAFGGGGVAGTLALFGLPQESEVKCCESKHHDGASFGAKVGLDPSLGRCQTTVQAGFTGSGTLLSWLAGAAEPTGGEMVPYGTFDAVCSLHGSIHDCGGPSCDGLVLTARGPAYLTQVYSRTNPQDLPALDGCLENGAFTPRLARSNTGRWTDSTLNITSRAQHIAARRSHNKRRADHRDGATTEKVYLGLALLYSGHMDADSTHKKHSGIEFCKGWFEYVNPLTNCDMYDPVNANSDVAYDCDGDPLVCGCYDFDANDNIGAYRGPPGWVEVTAADVPSGTPLVKPYNYNLHFYEEIHEEEQGYEEEQSYAA